MRWSEKYGERKVRIFTKSKNIFMIRSVCMIQRTLRQVRFDRYVVDRNVLNRYDVDNDVFFVQDTLHQSTFVTRFVSRIIFEKYGVSHMF